MRTAGKVVASICYFFLVANLALGSFMGDCLPEMGHACPTDRQRNMRMLFIVTVGVAIYILLAIAVSHAEKRNSN